LVTTQVV